MIFTRTHSGLSNMRYFQGVDLVVFTEGGPDISYSIDEALDGHYHKQSDDIEFWEPLFARYQPNLSVSFRALGTKNTLKEIARRLAEGLIVGVCVVMDKDFDDLFGQTISHKQVLYTHKYSWESDVFETGVIWNGFQHIALARKSQRQVEAEIRPVIMQIRRELRHLVRADIVLCAAGKSLFRRNGTGSAFQERRRSQPPRLDVRGIRDRLAAEHAEIRGFRLLRQARRVHVRKDCLGKLFLMAAIQTLYYLLDINGQPRLAREYCIKFLVLGFHEWLIEKPGSGTARYYARVVGAVG